MGYWKTIREADGWDSFSDKQVWIDDDGKKTDRMRETYDSFYARKPGETFEQSERRKHPFDYSNWW